MAKQDPNPQDERAAATAAYVGVVMDDAWRIRFELYNEDPEAGPIGLFPRRRANRDALRGFVAQGHLTPEQIAEVNELYPPRRAGEDEEAPEEAQTPGEAPTPETANA